MAGGPFGGTAFTRAVGCRLPVQEAVLGGDVGGARLAAAVCRAAGLGMLSESGYQPLDERLDWLDQHCQGPYGVGLFAYSETILSTLDTVAGRARVIDVFWGPPDAGLVARIHAMRALCLWQVGSFTDALAAADAGCDAVVVQGREAGGHVSGTVPLLELLDVVVPRLEVPVVAAGGIADGHDTAQAMAHGAAAVRLGTRLLATVESNAHPDYVAALVAAGPDATEVTTAFGADWPDAPHRVLHSARAAAAAAGPGPAARHGQGGASWEIARWSAFPPTRATTGDIAGMALYAGTGVERVSDCPSAAEAIERLTVQALADLGGSWPA